ncbi:MAG: hypothetical protein HUK19_09920 [Fibrobacter sp.]|nr:hypothetical protein [Fibrobacter sp.]
MKRNIKPEKQESCLPQDLISKDRTLAQVRSRIEDLAHLIQEKTLALRHAPEGRLRISMQGRNRRPHYYHVKDENINGEYIPKENMVLIKALAQKGYDQKILKVAKRQISLLEQFIRGYGANAIEDVYSGPFREGLVAPVVWNDNLYAKRWIEVPFEGLPFDENLPPLITSDGRRVRSKSELIIAETLIGMNIPFKYESPKMLGKVRVHPDFTCLNVNTRTEIIWEHFGMMDLSEYACNMVGKMNLYQKHGYRCGVNFIFTMETVKSPIKPEMVKRWAEDCLL